MRITKIKYKDDAVEIHLHDKIGKMEKESIFKCSELPSPDFIQALTNMVAVVYSILELPEDWRQGCMKVTGVTFSLSEETEVEGAVITGRVELSTADAPLNFNTPHLPFAQYSETGRAPLMSDFAVLRLGQLRDEARQYMEGKRAQLEFAQSQGEKR